MTITSKSSTIIPFKPNNTIRQDVESAAAPAYRWFRLYNEVLNDPKVQRLDGETFKSWINILCLASQNAGVLPCQADLAFALRITEQAAGDLLNALHDHKLLDEVQVPDSPVSYTPHNWNGRQYKSDADPTAPARSKRYRDRKRNASVTRDVTRDCYDQSRADTEQSRYRTETETDLSKQGFLNGKRKEDSANGFQAENKQPMAENKTESSVLMAAKKAAPQGSAVPPKPSPVSGLYTYSQLPPEPRAARPRPYSPPEDDDPDDRDIPF
jgi:hypothetical protein